MIINYIVWNNPSQNEQENFWSLVFLNVRINRMYGWAFKGPGDFDFTEVSFSIIIGKIADGEAF